MAPLGALSQAWVSAEASLPLGWGIDGLMQLWVYGQFSDTAGGEEWPDAGKAPWVAIATHELDTDPHGSGMVLGGGSTPEQALRRLADRLRNRRGPATG